MESEVLPPAAAYLGLQGLQWQTSNCFSKGEQLFGRRGFETVHGLVQWFLKKFLSTHSGSIGSSWSQCSMDQLLVISCLGCAQNWCHTHSVNELGEHNQMCIVPLKCKKSIKCCISFSVIRSSRCSKLFFTCGRGSLDSKKFACGGRPLNFSGVHLPNCGSIYNPNTTYSVRRNLLVWWTSKNTGRRWLKAPPGTCRISHVRQLS